MTKKPQPEAKVRAASGRLYSLDGVSPQALKRLSQDARRRGVGLILWNGREPAEEADRGGLCAVLVSKRASPEELDRISDHLSASAAGDEAPFRFLSRIDERTIGSEEDFLAAQKRRGVDASHEHYARINMPQSRLVWTDFGNGLLASALFTASFSVGLGFHPIIPVIGYLYGTMGRYLARLRTGIVFVCGNDSAANGAALLFDLVHGMALMALVINPVTGLGLGLPTIAWVSTTHALTKGALRLTLDKRFSTDRHHFQALGVATSSLLDFALGVMTSFCYAGFWPARLLQAATGIVGLYCLLVKPRILVESWATARAAT